MLSKRTRLLPDAESFLHTSHVADILYVSPTTITRWAEAGRLPHQRTLGGHRRSPRVGDPAAGRWPGPGGAGLVSAHPDSTSTQPPGERGRIAYTVAEVAAMLGKHPNTIYEWVQRGALPAEKLGGTIYVPKWVLARLLSPAPHEQPASAVAPAGAGGELS